MKAHWWVIGGMLTALSLALFLALFVWFVVSQPAASPVGNWTSSLPWGAPASDLGLMIQEDGLVTVTAAPRSPIWWASGQYELRRVDNTIEIRSGQTTVGELRFKQRGDKLWLLDTSDPTETLPLKRNKAG